MAFKHTEITPTEMFWVIVRIVQNNREPMEDERGDFVTKEIRYFLIEYDTATALNDYIEAMSVRAGESMGDLEFKVIQCCTSWQELQSIADREKESEEETY